MDRAQKPSGSDWYSPPSEPFRFYRALRGMFGPMGHAENCRARSLRMRWPGRVARMWRGGKSKDIGGKRRKKETIRKTRTYVGG
jgi:hypothetical protein